MNTNLKTNDELRAEIKALAPWHLLVNVNDQVSTQLETQVGGDGRKVSLVDGQPVFQKLVKSIYPDGLKNKDFLDCACNCGGYSFWAKELGARSAYGFDVREHWINQANFLKNNKSSDTSGMNFRVADLYDIPNTDIPDCDMTWFSGIFYHLPDPIRGLKIAADKTREVLYLNTDIMTQTDEEIGSGSLYLSFEGKEHLMSGVHHLNWFPSGPVVLTNILNWLGFPEVKVVMWRKKVNKDTRPEHLRKNIGRIALVAARQKGMLDSVVEAEAVSEVQHTWTPAKMPR